MNGTGDGHSISETIRSRLDRLRPFLGAVFLAAYAASSFAPESVATEVLLVSGIVLYAMSVPWASTFHKGLAVVAFAVLGATIISGRFDAASFFGKLPDYFNIVAVLLVLSMAGYPIRAERFTVEIQSLAAAMTRRGVGIKSTATLIGQFLGAVLDVGALVITDALARRAAPKERVEALLWAGRGFSFAPMWTTLNVLTATTIELTGLSYGSLLAITLPFALLGVAGTIASAQRQRSEVVQSNETPGRGAAVVVLYPVALVAAVAVAHQFISGVLLTAAVSLTVVGTVILSAILASIVLRRRSPLGRLSRESNGALTASHSEFALFGSAGVLVLSLTQIGALAPLGDALSALPQGLVAPALLLLVGLGFIGGIHVVPLVLLIDTAFPLDAGPAPALWAAAILIGAQSALLLTPFSNVVTMLAKLTGLHPIEVGTKSNWRFGLIMALAGLLYIAALSALLP